MYRHIIIFTENHNYNTNFYISCRSYYILIISGPSYLFLNALLMLLTLSILLHTKHHSD